MDPCTGGVGCRVAQTAYWLVQPMADSTSGSAAAIAERFPLFWPLAAGVVGSVAASLGGLVADRLPRINGWNGRVAEPGLSLSKPASHCEACGRRIPFLALVPVAGWFMAKGRCAACGTSVPLAYPLAEAVVAVLSMAFVFALGPTSGALLGCLALWTLAFVSWLDWTTQTIPDGLSVPLLFLGLLASPFEADAWARSLGAASTALCIWGAFGLTSSLKRVDASASGDVALGAALGGWLGFCAAPAFLLCAAVAYLAYAVPLRARKGEVWVPMGPALSAGFVAVALAGAKIAL